MTPKAILLLAAAASLPASAQNSRPQAALVDTATPAPRDTPYPGVMTLDVDATQPARGVFRVKQTVPVSAPGKLTLLLAKWLPGNHGPTGLVAAFTGLRVTAGGRPLGWTRDPLDVYAFDIDVPPGVRQLDLAFEVLAPTREDQGRIVTTPDMLNLQWEKMALYPAGHYTRQIRIRPTVTLPAGWTGVSAIDGAERTGRIAYPETDFETMVDSPMFAGRHFRKWELGGNVDLNVFADRPEDLAAEPWQIAAHRKLVTQARLAFGNVHYDRYDFLLALSEDLWGGGGGIEHHRSSENAEPRNYFTGWKDTGALRGLLPHEYTHSWNGKFRRPADLYTADYRTPMQNSLLWVYEGQTSFWDVVLGARSDMVPKDVALGEIASTAATYSTQPGRRWRPLVDTTNQPILAYGRSSANASYQRGGDYYSESALIWIEADQIIREKTRGRRSMDDFARSFFGIRDGDWGEVTYTLDDVVAALGGVVAHDWAGFIRSRVYETADAPTGGIRRGGYKLVFKDEPNAYDASSLKRRKVLDLTHSLGMTIGKGGAVSGLVWDAPAFAAGLTSNSAVVAVDRREYSDDEMRGAIARAKTSREPIRLLVKEGTRYRDVEIAYAGGLRYPHLEKVAKGVASLDRMLEARR